MTTIAIEQQITCYGCGVIITDNVDVTSDVTGDEFYYWTGCNKCYAQMKVMLRGVFVARIVEKGSYLT